MHFNPLGFGVGLRRPYFSTFLNQKYKDIDWVEALTENYLPWESGEIRRPFKTLIKIRENLPVTLHGVSLSIGSSDPLDMNYLKRLKALAEAVEPAMISDHLCWTGIGGVNTHDLLPVPYTKEALHWIIERVGRVQEYLGTRILLENPSSYLEFSDSEMSEADFLREVAERADCGILLDVNNIYVSSQNHGFDPLEYLERIPWKRVGQIHLAGHVKGDELLVDTHDQPVGRAVWNLYQEVARRVGSPSVMIERDARIPPWKKLEAEVQKARRLWYESNEPKTHRTPKAIRSSREVFEGRPRASNF